MVSLRFWHAVLVTALAAPLHAQGVAPQSAPAQAREFHDYYSVFEKTPWSIEESGPLIAVCPVGVTKGQTLAEIQRKTVRIGRITAIVPTRMVTLDSNFSEPPNLYDGLPMEAKVLYLLTLLKDDQWSRVTGEGLSLADCQGEQTAVMNSILPSPFTYVDATLTGPHSLSLDPSATRHLSDQDRSQIKLRISRHLELSLGLTNGSATGASLRDSQRNGSKVPLLMDNSGDEYGHHIRIESDNVPKRSQIDIQDSRLNAMVALKSGEELSDLLNRIGSASGLRFIADPHYAPMRLFELGAEASARDLIQTISLGVTGTYCDLEGIAAHQIRIAAWEDDVRRLINERQALWRSVVGKGAAMAKVKFDPGAYDSLTPSELKNLNANDGTVDGETLTDPDSASPAVRLEIKEFNDENGGNDVQKVGLHSGIRFELVLPDGSKPWGLKYLGSGNQFKPSSDNGQPPQPVPLPFKSPASLKALILRADTPQMAREDVERVHRLGIGELWLETWSPEVLQAAIDSATPDGIKVSAAVRPWSLEPSQTAQDPDRTATGTHGAAFASSKANFLTLQRLWPQSSTNKLPIREQVAPLDPQTFNRWKRVKDFASLSALSSIVLLDAYPIGYAKEANEGGSYYCPPIVDAFLSYGYSDAQRLVFLQAKHVDPLDLENPTVHTVVSIRDAWGSGTSNGSEFNEWQKSKGDWIHDALLSLTTALSSLKKPILLPAQPEKSQFTLFGTNYLSKWNPGSDLPSSPPGFGYINGDVAVIEIQPDIDPSQLDRVATTVQNQLANPGQQLILDFSAIPATKLDSTIKAWLKK